MQDQASQEISHILHNEINHTRSLRTAGFYCACVRVLSGLSQPEDQKHLLTAQHFPPRHSRNCTFYLIFLVVLFKFTYK